MHAIGAASGAGTAETATSGETCKAVGNPASTRLGVQARVTGLRLQANVGEAVVAGVRGASAARAARTRDNGEVLTVGSTGVASGVGAGAVAAISSATPLRSRSDVLSQTLLDNGDGAQVA